MSGFYNDLFGPKKKRKGEAVDPVIADDGNLPHPDNEGAVGMSAPNTFSEPTNPNATPQIDEPNEDVQASMEKLKQAKVVADEMERGVIQTVKNAATVVGTGVGAGVASNAARAGLGWLGTVLRAGQAGGAIAAGQAAGPALNAAAPIVEGAVLQDAGMHNAGPASMGFSFGAVPETAGKKLYSGIDPEPIADMLRNTRSFPAAGEIVMPDDPSMKLRKSLELLNSRKAGAGETWGNRARSWRVGDEDQQKAFLEYLDAANNDARVRRAQAAGMPVPDLPNDITPADNWLTLMQKKRQFGLDPTDAQWVPPGEAMPDGSFGPTQGKWFPKGEIIGTPEQKGRAYFDSLMPKIEEARSEMLNVGKATGQMDAGQGLLGAPLPDGAAGPIGYDGGFQGFEDYVPNVLEMRFQDRNRLQMLADTEAHNRFNLGVPAAGRAGFSNGPPGITKATLPHYEGSKQALEGDAFQRLAWKGAQVERNAMMNQFVDRLKPLEIDTTVPGFKFDPETMGAYVRGPGDIAVFPRDVALALSEAGEQREVGMIQKGLGFFNNLTRQGLLKYNPSFQIKQVADDLAVGMANVPLGKQKEFLGSVKQHMETLLGEYAKVNEGEFSPVLAAYRRRGTMNEIFESLVETQNEVRQFSEKTMGHETSGLSKWLDEAGQVRETAVKSALADMYEGMGATPERAASLANQVTGDYISRSKTGKELGEFIPMMKWYTNAVKRLTVAALEDPVTAKRNPLTMSGAELQRAASTSPLSKIIPAAIAASILNGAMTGGKHWDADGIIFPGTNQKIGLPGYGAIIGGVSSEKTPGATMSGLEDRLASILQAASLMTKGETIGGRKADPFSYHSVSPGDRAREMARRGGLGINNPLLQAVNPFANAENALLEKTDSLRPTAALGFEHGGNLSPEAQKALEGFSALPGVFRRATSQDVPFSNNLAGIARSISPFQITDVEQQGQFDFEDQKDALLKRIAAGDASAIGEWAAGGGTAGEIKRDLKGGQKQKTLFESLTPEQRQEYRKKHNR